MTNLQPPAHSESVKVAFPVPHVLLLSFNRPSALNAMSQAMHADMKAMLDWFEDEPELWCVFFNFLLIFCPEENEATSRMPRVIFRYSGSFLCIAVD